MVASADPSARFKLVCSRLLLAALSSRQTFGQQHQRSDDDSHHGFRHIKAGYSEFHRGSENLGKTNNGDERDEKKTGAQNSSSAGGRRRVRLFVVSLGPGGSSRGAARSG